MALARRCPIALLALLALGGSPPDARADVIAAPPRASPVDADLAFAVWSTYDPAAGGFRMTLRSAGGRIRNLDAAGVSPVQFDADLGDDARRHRVVVYSRCDGTPGSCDVHVLRIADGRDTRVDAAARPGVDETAPTVSRGRLAWVSSTTSAARPRVWLTELEGTSAPTELPGLPQRLCGERVGSGRGCSPVTGRISRLELRGRRLAQAASLSAQGFLRWGQLRVVDTRARTSQVLLQFGAGESGQEVIGPSIDESYVYAYKTCFGDPSGCGSKAGIYRFGPDGRAALAPARRQLSGFAVDRGGVFASEGRERLLCELEQGSYPGVPGATIGPCPIETRRLPATWRRVTTAPVAG